MKNDFINNGKADILVTSPWGLGLLTLRQNTIAVHTMSQNGSPLGEWALNTHVDNTELKADFDGDGRAELLMSSPWGIGILKLVNGSFKSIAMAQNGTNHGGWIINTLDNQFLHAADFNGDRREEVLVSSSSGIGILKYANRKITSLMIITNGMQLGSWLLNTNDNFFTLFGDFDGDRKTEILVTSPMGLGILKYNGTTLSSVVVADNGTRFDDWELNTSTDRFEAVGDFDGDGRAEILVSNSNKVGILKLQGNNLTSICVAGDHLGSWELDSGVDKMNIAGDFDGDGKDEILISRGNTGLSVLKLNGATLQSTLVARNGTRFDGWLLNTRDNRLNYAADFDGDGKVEIQISSPWGMGILKQSGNTFDVITMSPNGTRFGDWLLNTADNDLEAGLGKSYGLIIYHSGWQEAVDRTATFLKRRGYIMFVTPNGANGVARLKKLALYLKASDKIFVYLAGHGGTTRSVEDEDNDTCLEHTIQFKEDTKNFGQFAPVFHLMGNKGVDLSVLDGSCHGGESVLYALGERYLMMSTTSLFAPGIVNKPKPSEMMKMFGKPSKFGLWWSSYYAASLMTSDIQRFYQKLYRNDNTEINRQSLFYKRAIDFYKEIGGEYYLRKGKCYLYQFIYPTEFEGLSQEEKDSMTVATNNFLAPKRAELNARAPWIVKLKNILNNTTLINQGAELYAQSFPRPWQTIFGDMNWDIAREPIRQTYNTHMPITPISYTGKAGFLRMIAEILDLIELLEQCYIRAENLLNQIDAEVTRKKMYKGIIKAQPMPVEKITDYLEFNAYEQKRIIQYRNIVNSLNVDLADFFKIPGKTAKKLQKQTPSNYLIDKSLAVLSQQVTVKGFNSPLLDNLIASFKRIELLDAMYLDKLWYLLIIAEEAISKVQANQVEPGDLVRF